MSPLLALVLSAGASLATVRAATVPNAVLKDGPYFNVSAGQNLLLDGSGSSWTSGWQYFIWTFGGCTPSLQANWQPPGLNSYKLLVTTGVSGQTFDIFHLSAPANCTITFTVMDNCE